MSYNAMDKALIVAAVERYGPVTGLRFAEENYGLDPSRTSVYIWMTTDGLKSTSEARDELDRIEQGRRTRLQAAIEPRVHSIMEAVDAAVEKGQALATQQFATAAGIFYDKLVPLARSGAAVSVGAGAQAIIMVAASPNPEGAAHEDIPQDYIEGESREVGDV